MSPTWVVVIAVVGAVVLFTPIVWLTTKLHRGQRARFDELMTIVQARGWHYAESSGFPEWVVPVLYSLTKTWPRVRPPWIGSVTSGQYRNHWFVSASYLESPKGDGPQATHEVGIHLPAALPRFSVVPAAKMLKQLGNSLGRDQLRIGDEYFDQHFTVETDNHQFAADVLNADLVEWLRTVPEARSKGFRFDREWMWLCESTIIGGAARDVNRVVGGLDFLCDVFDRIPATVWERAR